MPTWVGPAVPIGLAVIGAFFWLVRQYIQAQIDSALKDIRSDLAVLTAQRKSDLELMNVKIGTVESTLKRHEGAISHRVRSVERIVGKAVVFNASDSDEDE